MKIAYTGFNTLPDEQCKCDMIIELTDCMYGFSNSGLIAFKIEYHAIGDIWCQPLVSYGK